MTPIGGTRVPETRAAGCNADYKAFNFVCPPKKYKSNELTIFSKLKNANQSASTNTSFT